MHAIDTGVVRKLCLTMQQKLRAFVMGQRK